MSSQLDTLLPQPQSQSQSQTDEIWRKDHDHFLHPFAEYPSFEEEGCLVIDRAAGAYIYDADGNRYLDGIGGMWCVNIGYGVREMADTMARQAQRLHFYNTFVDTTNAPAAELEAKLADLAPERLNRVFFSSGGSVANDTAVRTIHYYFNRLGKPSKKKIISRQLAYHGNTYMTMTLNGYSEEQDHFHVVENLVEHVSAPYVYRRPEGTTEGEFCDQLVAELED